MIIEIIAVALFLILVAGLAILLIYLLKIKRRGTLARSLNLILLLITVPKEKPKEGGGEKQEKELIAKMKQVYSGLYLFKSGDFSKKFKYGIPYFAMELAVHHAGEEIHFYMAVPRKLQDTIEKQIQSAFPQSQIQEVPKDYNIFNPQGVHLGAYAKLQRSSILPTKTFQTLESDPLSAITNAFSKLKEIGEGAAIQILIRPAPKKYKNLGFKTAKLMQEGKSYEEALNKAQHSFFRKMLGDAMAKPNEQKPEQKPVTPFAQETLKAIENKAGDVSFEANIRLIASAPTQNEAEMILSSLEGAFSQFDSPGLNSFHITKCSKKRLEKLFYNFAFRIFDKSEISVLGSEELTSLYHLPTPYLETPKLKILKAKMAAAPANAPKEGIILGKNIYRGVETPIRMTRDDRRRHLYIIGQTGTGKSNFLKWLASQDIESGEGMCMIDPHGDLIEDTLSMIPKERAEDVIVFSPGDIERPLGMNVLEIDPSQPQQKSFVIDDLFKILKMIYKESPEAFGPLFEKFFKNALMLLLDDYQNEIPTLGDISRVFADKEYRDLKLSRETNPEIISFWRYEAEQMSGDWSLPNMSGYITSKLAPFLINEYMRPIIGQQKSAFNFRKVMDEKKILLVNLSKGLIGDLNASLLGMIIVSKILVAAFSRVDISDENKRPDFYLYIDEFQNFTTDSIATILSEARKYRLGLIIAHQFIKQLQENIRNAVFGNVGSMMAFRVGPDDTEFLVKSFGPTFTETDLLNIDNFQAYLRLLINSTTTTPFNISIYPAKKGPIENAQAIKELNRLKYGRDRADVEREIRERYTPPTPQE